MRDAVLFVPENEAKAYRKVERNEVVPVPQEVQGVAQTRNWILDQTDDAWVVLLDDDVRATGWVHLFEHAAAHEKVAAADLVEEWARLFELTEDMGYRVWGLTPDGATRTFYPYKPFLWRCHIPGACMGLRNDTGLRFDETFPVEEDVELSLRCIKEDGGVVGCRYLYWQTARGKGVGGRHDLRTVEQMDTAVRRLIDMYPGFIRKVTRGGDRYTIELEF